MHASLCAAASLLVVSVACRAGAEPQAGLVGRIDARALEYVPADRSRLRGEATIGVLVRGVLGKSSFPLVYAAGLDYRLGMGLPASLALETNLLPVGFGVVAGRHGLLLLTAGIGVSGVTGGLLRFSGQFPLEARLELDLPGPLHGSFWLRPSWVTTAHRRSGVSSLGIGDELAAGFGIRTGREGDKYDFAQGSGFLLGTEYVERDGSRAFGIVLGHELDGIFHP